jgi:hypothetical protein
MIIKLRMIGWAGHVGCMEKMGNSYFWGRNTLSKEPTRET